MTAADRLDMLACYGVRIALSADSQRLDVTGPDPIVRAAETALRFHRAAILDHLRNDASHWTTAATGPAYSLPVALTR